MLQATLDMAAWLRANGLEVNSESSTSGYHRWHIDCPFDANHKNKDAYVFAHRDGYHGFHCSHDSCKGRTWRDARNKIEGRGGAKVQQFLLDKPQWSPNRPRVVETNFDFDATSLKDLLVKEIKMDWLVQRCFVYSQPILIGGASKSLKTSVTLDLAVSLATGTPWLGHYAVNPAHRNEPVPTFMCSGESGEYTVKETCQRILDSKRAFGARSGGDYPLMLSFKVPKLSLPEHLERIREEIVTTGTRVFIVDPTYLAMLSSGNSDNANNVFAMGSILRDLQEAVSDTGVTLCLLHHFRKAQRGAAAMRQPPTLEEFSMAGFAEYARQWVLLKRSEHYMGDGLHYINCQVGGSCGQGELFPMKINEGPPSDELGHRIWEVNYGEEPPRAGEQAAPEITLEEAMVLRLQRADEPLGRLALRGVTRNNGNVHDGLPSEQDAAAGNAAIERLLEEGRIEETQDGRHPKYRLRNNFPAELGELFD